MNRVLLVLLGLVLAYAATESIFFYAQAENTAQQSVAWQLVFFLTLLGLRRVERIRQRRTGIAAACLACALACALLIGREISTEFRLGGIIGGFPQLATSVWRLIGLGTPLYILFTLFIRWATMENSAMSQEAKNPPYWVLWGGLLLFWLPYYLSFFPGSITGDSLVQLNQAYGLKPLHDGHPVLHTGLIAACLQVAALFGAPGAGIGIYSALQMLLMTAAFAYGVHALLHVSGCRRLYGWLLYAWYALLPAHPLLGMTMWKDVLHAGSAMLVMTQLFLWARDPKAAFASLQRMVALTGSLFLLATLRHNGLFVCLLLLPCFLVCYRAHWRRALAVCLGVLVFIGIYKGPVLAALKVQRGSIAEALSIPSQFIARTVVFRGEDLSMEDKTIIGEILPYDRLAALYNPQNADNIKNNLDMESLGEDPLRYVSLFIRLGIRYPALLAESILCNTYGYWYPETSYIMAGYDMLPNPTGAERHSMGIPDETLHDFVEWRLRRMPGISMLFSCGIMIWIVALAAAILWARRKRGGGLPLLMLLFLWLSLLTLPVFGEYRYAYGLVVSAPLCLGFALSGKSDTAN